LFYTFQLPFFSKKLSKSLKLTESLNPSNSLKPLKLSINYSILAAPQQPAPIAVGVPQYPQRMHRMRISAKLTTPSSNSTSYESASSGEQGSSSPSTEGTSTTGAPFRFFF
jgi:hypothetical protein